MPKPHLYMCQQCGQPTFSWDRNGPRDHNDAFECVRALAERVKVLEEKAARGVDKDRAR